MLCGLKRHTRVPWELIAIDNGSTDGTASYLAGVRDMAAVPVTIVSNPKNVGFPAAVNQGLRPARGEYLVLLNNDVVVTDGWLDQPIALVNAEREGVGWRACRRKGDLLSSRGAGSGDPRQTLAPLRPEELVAGCPGASPPGPSVNFVRANNWCQFILLTSSEEHEGDILIHNSRIGDSGSFILATLAAARH